MEEVSQPRKTGKPGRNYVFTINYKDNEKSKRDLGAFFRLLDPSLWGGAVSYVIYQLECGANGTLHYQGYLECVGKKSYVQLHALDGLEGATFDVRHGTGPQAIAYCKKRDETYLDGPWEWGEAKAPGTRSDLLEIQAKLDASASFRSIAADHFGSYIRYGKAFREYKRIKTLCRNFKSRVFLFIGPPGKGKSTVMKLIAQRLGSVYKAPQPKGSGWYFDDYDGEDVFLIDEFDGATCRPTFYNSLCDEHECVIPVHGGAGHQMISKFIFIGSNYLPAQWWRKRSPAQVVQTTRRIDVIFKMGFQNAVRWDHSGFQVFGNNTNQPVQRVIEREHPGDMYGLPRIQGG